MFDLQESVNVSTFYLRNKVKWSLGTYKEKYQDKSKLKLLQEERFRTQYNLESLWTNATIRNYKENLYTIELLETYLTLETQDYRNVLDIGSKNFFYAKGLYAFFKNHTQVLYLDGIELDAYRIYRNLYSRYDYARFYINGLSNVTYITNDLMNVQAKYDSITWILPFVFSDPLKAWGLPKKYFQPLKMLEKAHSLLKTNGIMLILNQGLDEKIEQLRLLDELELTYETFPKPFISNFLDYKFDRYVTLVHK